LFTGLRARLMLSFSLLLLVCLCTLTLTFALLLVAWGSVQNLAYARLADAAAPAVVHIRELRQQGERLLESIEIMYEQASERGMRFLAVSMPGGAILADTEGQWVGQRIQITPLPAEMPARQTSLRGRARGPDGKRLFCMAVSLAPAEGESPRTIYLVLTMTWREAIRPLIRSLLASAALAGAVALALSVLFALWLARTLSDPLRRAAVAAERVAAGDYDVSLDIALPEEGRRLANSFNTMTRAVQASQRSQRDFVANVSHELRTPLTSIQGFAQAILDGTAHDEQDLRRAASVIYGEAERLSRMVHKLLDLARLETGEIAMSQSQVDLVPLLQACIERFDALARERHIRLAADLPPTALVTGDGDRLMQVFTNLVDNALKHTNTGGKVALTLTASDESVSISVADTGRGIPAEDLSRIFERFYQVEKSRSRHGNLERGVGLGSAIALEIVHAHGGDIQVESIVDVGTRFVVHLPRHPAKGQKT
jgi:two-component system OmpR family sensor kinase